MIRESSDFIHLRLFCELETEDAARVVGKNLSEILSEFGHSMVFKVEPYWKVPEYFEISILIRNSSGLKRRVRDIASRLSEDWMSSGGSLIWEMKNVVQFIDPSVRWAELEYIEE
jgi:hypothetical protein